jgi:ABC-type transport system involved in cytochrome c biogenesis permease subunit
MSNQLILFYLSLAGYFAAAVIQFIAKPRIRRGVLIPVWLIHTAFLVQRWLESGHLPLSGLFEPLNFFGWCILGLLIIACNRPGASGSALLIATALMLVAAVAPKKVFPLPEALQTIWFELHVASAFIAYAIFAVAAAACMRGGDTRLGLRFTAWGVLVFSVSMLIGGIWAYLAWADYWVWTPKELWSVLIWLYYATVLHAARLPGWRKRVGGMVILGFILLMFTYLGVGLLMKSSHPL